MYMVYHIVLHARQKFQNNNDYISHHYDYNSTLNPIYQVGDSSLMTWIVFKV